MVLLTLSLVVARGSGVITRLDVHASISIAPPPLLARVLCRNLKTLTAACQACATKQCSDVITTENLSANDRTPPEKHKRGKKSTCLLFFKSKGPKF